MRLTRSITLLVCAVCAVLGALLSYIEAAPVWLDGVLFDRALSVRARLTESPAKAEHVAVVAIDPESLNSEALAPLPRAFFGPVWGQLIGNLTEAGAQVVAFDVLFTYSASNFSRNYDRPFLAALYRNKNRVVLGRSTESFPVRNYMAALRNDPGTLGNIDVFPDADEVFRTSHTVLTGQNGEAIPTLSGAALARVGAKEVPADVVLAPKGHPENVVPTYGLAAVLRCAQKDPESLKAAFDGRVIFVGTTMPEEDRKTSSARFIPALTTTPEAKPPCGLTQLPPSVPDADDVPGVHLHALATEAVLSNSLTLPASAHLSAFVTAAAALTGAAVGFLLAPLFAIAVMLFTAGALWVGQIGLLGSGIWLPMGMAVIAVAGSTIIAYVIRFVLEEGKRRRIQKAFGFYLAPALVDRMVDSAEDLHLGGETRDVTIMFADLSGFTALSGIVGPEELVTRTNEYLTLIADEVEATGGYVDKFIGDAVMAIWGAPVALEDHAGMAAQAAIRIGDRIAAQKARADDAGEHGFAVKVGVNSGPAVVGNVGSEKRFNYTAVGEAVNIAARLEGLPSVYDCWIIFGAATAERVRDRHQMRELDKVAVKGKSEPLQIFEPLNASNIALREPYEKALALYRAQKFNDAIEIWDSLDDGPSRVMAERARMFLQSPPPQPWDGGWVMTSK